MEKKNYSALDLCKFCMMLLVVSVHTGLISGCSSEVLRSIYRMLVYPAVTTFFVIAGFLLGTHLQEPFSSPENGPVLKRYLSRMLKLYLIWMGVYTPLAIGNYIKHSTPVWKAFALYLRGLLLQGQQYNSWQLWYLLSTVYALCLLLWLYRRGATLKKAAIVGCGIMVIGYCLDCLIAGSGKIGRILYLTIDSGRIPTGFFYLTMGMLLAKKRPPKYVSWALLLIGCGIILTIPERLTLFYRPMVSVGLVGILADVRLPDRKIYPFLRKMSTVGYLIHMYAYVFFCMAVYGEETDGVVPFLGTAALTLLISAGYTAVSRKIAK